MELVEYEKSIKVSKNDERVQKMLKKVEELEKKGYDVGSLDAEKFLLTQEFFGKKGKVFEIKSWKIVSEQRNGEFSECIIIGKVDGKDREVVAPTINALAVPKKINP